jgi:hypothetical protein
MAVHTIPEYLREAIAYACPDSSLLSISVKGDESLVSRVLSDGVMVRNSIGDVGELLKKNHYKTYGILKDQAGSYGSNGNDSYHIILGIPHEMYTTIQKRKEEQAKKLQYKARNGVHPSSNGNGWPSSIDRMLLYQSRMITPMNVKGYISLKTGEIVENSLFVRNGWYIG